MTKTEDLTNLNKYYDWLDTVVIKKYEKRNGVQETNTRTSKGKTKGKVVRTNGRKTK